MVKTSVRSKHQGSQRGAPLAQSCGRWLLQHQSACALPADTHVDKAANGAQVSCCAAVAGRPDIAACSSGTSWHICDLRSADAAQTCSAAHPDPILSIDVAASAPHLLVTAGQDCTSRVWDTRWASFKNSLRAV